MRRAAGTLAAAVTGAVAVAAPAVAAPVQTRYDDPYRHPHTIVNAELAAIEAAPAGATINMVNPYVDMTFAKPLAAAMARGVDLHFVTTAGTYARYPAGPWLQAKVAASPGSTFTACTTACVADAAAHPGAQMHAKTLQVVYPDGRYLTEVASNDLTGTTVRTQFNSDVVTPDPKIGAAVRRWVYGMRTAPDSTVGHTVTGKNLQLFTFPRPTDTSSSNFYLRALAPISCKGHTGVALTTSQWRTSMAAVVTRLGALQRAGCHVRVLAVMRRTQPAVVKMLRANKLNVRWSGALTTDPNAPVVKHSHLKMLLVAGRYAGRKAVRTVFEGSLNMALATDRFNDDDMVRIVNARPGHQYGHALAAFDAAWSHSHRAAWLAK